ncbi:MAG: hypothetical protein DRR08_22400 [Candidatus Parabeggiatoa sp. nov. 2]|nr:MAG: hypothetical protein B6247_10515 [Beggiatoa sp. 4572_84]RKZ56164.1 MAG: hypothetical protein DRR08_22400 [Gammaproteobacteria bacterium]
MKKYLGDILVYNEKRQLVLVVVTLNQCEKSREWVAEYRRNLYLNTELPKTPFFVIASPDNFYLWKEAEDEGILNPTYEMAPRFSLRGFLKRSGLSPDKLNRSSFELLVNGWFDLLQIVDEKTEICSRYPDWQLEQNQAWLFESGLFEAIKHGQLITRDEYDDGLY